MTSKVADIKGHLGEEGSNSGRCDGQSELGWGTLGGGKPLYRRHLKTTEGSSHGEIKGPLLQVSSSDQQHQHYEELVTNTDSGPPQTCQVRILLVTDAQGMQRMVQAEETWSGGGVLQAEGEARAKVLRLELGYVLEE